MAILLNLVKENIIRRDVEHEVYIYNSWTIGPGAGSAADLSSGAGTGGVNVNCIAIAISWIALGSFVFARLGGYEKALDFTRAGHRIVHSTLRPSFFSAPEAYRRGGKSGGYIAMKLNKTHFISSRHNWHLWINQYLRSTIFPH